MKEYWIKKSFIDCIKPTRVDRAIQIKQSAFLSFGTYPIVDQGQGLIAGWTNNDAAIVRDHLPLVIFGDHTRIFKYVDFPFALGADGTKIIMPRDDINPRYFYYALLSLDIPSRGYSRHYQLLKEKEIPLPPLPEQEKISAVLLKIQRAIETQDKIVQSLRDLKKSTMQHLFTHGLRGEKTKMTEIGEIPESWNVVTIASCCQVRSSTIAFSDLDAMNIHDNAGVLVQAIKVSDMNLPGNERDMKHANIRIHLPEATARVKAIPPNSIVFPKRGAAIATNKKRMTTQWTLLDPNLIAVIPVQAIEPLFLYYWFMTLDLTILQDHGPTPQLNKKNVDPLRFQIPKTKNEQQDIALALDHLDSSLTDHEKQIAILQDLFNTTLNKLMTGDIRVADLDINVKEVG